MWFDVSFFINRRAEIEHVGGVYGGWWYWDGGDGGSDRMCARNRANGNGEQKPSTHTFVSTKTPYHSALFVAVFAVVGLCGVLPVATPSPKGRAESTAWVNTALLQCG